MGAGEIATLLAELGPLLDPLGICSFPDSKSWGIAVEEETSIIVDLDEDRGKLVLSAEIGQPPDGDRGRLYELMLRHGYLWNETGGARLALDGPQGKVVQIADLSTDRLDLPRLGQAVRSFADATRAWREIIQRPPAEGGDAPVGPSDFPLIRI